ncbi:MAG: transposase [Planctomycetes bacterium]|nr:transposase [Planctomycetota bacterium]
MRSTAQPFPELAQLDDRRLGRDHEAAARATRGRSDAPERWCRYVLLPAIDQERPAWFHDGEAVFRFERPWQDGSKQVMFEPLVLIERLAAPLPRPRRNLITKTGFWRPAPRTVIGSCLPRPTKTSRLLRSARCKGGVPLGRRPRTRSLVRRAAAPGGDC